MNCTATSISLDQMSVKILWDNIHTGGLNLTNSTIEYALYNSTDNTSSNFITTSSNFISPNIDTLVGEAILRILPTAGQNYVFRVFTENDKGNSEPSECPVIFQEFGKFY